MNITINDIDTYCRVSKALIIMGEEFIRELRYVVPLHINNIFGIRKSDILLEKVEAKSNNFILLTIYDLTKPSKKVCLSLNAPLFIENRKKCAEEYYEENCKF